MRFLRTIRLDASDRHVFDRAAEPGEWAVSGAFVFAAADPAVLTAKARQAFRNGFLGLESFGWSTLVSVATISEDDYTAAVEALARYLFDEFGAPSIEAARAAAGEEAAFARDLCEHEVNTLIAVEREIGENGVIERFRTVRRSEPGVHARIWTIVDDDDDGPEG